MKEQNEIDRLLRDSLDAFRPEPDASRKKKFLDEAALLVSRKRITGFNWKWMIISLMVIGLTGTIYFMLSGKKETPSSEIDRHGVVGPVRHDSIHHKPLTAKGNNASTPADTLVSTTFYQPNTRLFPDKTKSEDQDENFSGMPGSSMSIQGHDFMASENEESIEYQGLEGREMTSQKNYEMSSREQPETVPASVINPLNEIVQDSIEITEEVTAEWPELVDTPAKHGAGLSYGLFYKPELLFNITDNNKLVHAAGAEIQYRFQEPRFLIRTGLGISFSKGYNEYLVNYNEYMGAYQRLDSVTFALAENNFTLIPVVHLSEQLVYDTAVQALPTKVYQQFLYLQVPLIAGYELILREKYSIGFRLGPVMSVLLNRNPAAVTYEAGMNQVVAVDPVTPERAALNWQLSAGLNFTIRGPGLTFVELEPAFSYYLGALHQDMDQKKNPYSLGLRLAFRVK